MGCWDEICVICGVGLGNRVLPSDEKNEDKTFRQINKEASKKFPEYNWLNKLLVITRSEDIYQTKFDGYDDYGSIIIEKKDGVKKPKHVKIGLTPENWYKDIPENNGIVCHVDCYKSLKYPLLFKTLEKKTTPQKINMTKIAKKYLRQDFQYNQLYNDAEWCLQSPLKNKKNHQRILSIWNKG